MVDAASVQSSVRPDRPITGRCSRQVGYATLVRGLDPHHYRCRSQSPASYGWGLEHLDLPEHVRTSHRRKCGQAPQDGNPDERPHLVTLPLVLWCKRRIKIIAAHLVCKTNEPKPNQNPTIASIIIIVTRVPAPTVEKGETRKSQDHRPKPNQNPTIISIITNA
jgi:hypothetical protein